MVPFAGCQAGGVAEQRLRGLECWGVLELQAVRPGATPLTLQPRFPSLWTSEPCSLLAQRFGCSPELFGGHFKHIQIQMLPSASFLSTEKGQEEHCQCSCCEHPP